MRIEAGTNVEVPDTPRGSHLLVDLDVQPGYNLPGRCLQLRGGHVDLEFASLRLDEQLIQFFNLVLELLREQVRRIQLRSHELAGSGRFDRALDELQAGDDLTASLIAEWPEDLGLKIMRGFLLKTLAQTFEAAGVEAHIAPSRERAAACLREIIDELGDDPEGRVADEHISALGNVAKPNTTAGASPWMCCTPKRDDTSAPAASASSVEAPT